MYSDKRPVLILMRHLLSTLKPLAVVGLLACSMMGTAAEEMKISKSLTISFDSYGGIENITSGGAAITETGCLVGKKENQSLMVQTWGTVLHNKVKCELGNDEFVAQGTLVKNEEPNVSQVDFKLTYRKSDEGVLLIRAEATPLEEAIWREPVYYSLLLPVSAYQGGTLKFEGADGSDRTYTVGESTMDLRTYGSRKLTVVMGKLKFVVMPGEGSQVSASDCRNWGQKAIRIEFRPRRECKSTHQIPAAQKDEFAATFTFTEKE